MKTPPALRQSRRFIYITGEFTANCIEVLRGKPGMVYERVEQDFLRHPDGVSPVWRRKAVLKYWALANPHAFATSETLRSVCASILRATLMR